MGDRVTLRPTLREILAAVGVAGAPPPAETGSPWYIRVLVGGGAWIASLFLAAFLALLDVIDWGQPSSAVAGAIVCAAAVALRRKTSGDFPVQLALAACVAGEILIVGGVTGTDIFHRGDVVTGAATVIALEALLLFIYPDAVHRFLSAAASVLAWGVLLHELKVPGSFDLVAAATAILAGLVWVHEPRLQAGRLAAIQAPAGYGLVAALLAGLLGALMSEGEVAIGGPATAGITLALLILAARIFAERGATLASEPALVALAGLAALGTITWNAPGVMAALGVLVLAFHRRDLVLLAFAALFLIAFLSRFYYDLEITLLAKSGVLLASGALLLALRFYSRRRFPDAEPAP